MKGGLRVLHTPPGAASASLPFAQTTAWSDSHVGRRIALDAAQAAGSLPAGEPFTGQPFCLGYVAEHGEADRHCALVAGHSCPCRFTRRLP